jgi:hypothetical protein
MSDILLLVVCILTSSERAQSPRFNPRDIVRQIPPASSTPSVVDCERVPGDGEFMIDTSVTITPASGGQGSQRVAFDGANFLVVWGDNGSASPDIYGARVTPQGMVLDSVDFVISQAAGDQVAPAMSFGGANFLVVWQDSRSGNDCEIYGARVTPEGTVLDTGGIAISRSAGGKGGLAVGSDGANFLIVWHDRRNGSDCDIYGARVTPQGTVLDTEGIIIARAASEQSFPALAFDGTNFLVTWGDSRSGRWDVYGARVTPQGTVLDTTDFVISQSAGDHRYPSICFDGTNFLVAWSSGPVYYRDIYGARVTPDGTVLDPSGITISRAADDQADAWVDFDGTNFLVTWGDCRSVRERIYGARVTSAGVVLDPYGFLISSVGDCQQGSALASDGVNSLVVWGAYQAYGGLLDLFGVRVTPQGTLLDTAAIAISTAANCQESPALAFDGTNFLVAWQDRRTRDGWDIYGARVTAQGAVLDSAGFAISTAANWQQSPALAFDRSNFLVAWRDDRIDTSGDIYGARVTPQGMVLDTAGFVISEEANGQHWPSVGFDGANYLVVWEDHRSGSDEIYGTRVTPSGVVLDTLGFVIAHTGSDQRAPVVGFDGANYLVVWVDRGGDINIYGARVTRAGVVLDPSGIAISLAPREQYYPSLAFDGTNFLVTWGDARRGSWDAYGARVSTAGKVLDTAGIPIMQWPGDQYSPAVGFDGASFLVVWQDTRSDDGDIYGTRVTPEGVVAECGLIARQRGRQCNVRLCANKIKPEFGCASSQMLLVYQGWAGTVDGKGYNTNRIWGSMDPNPGVAETPGEEVRTLNANTVVRGMLFLPSLRRTAKCSLLAIDGRKVLDLHPGANDVRALAPGVYFVREELQASSNKPLAVRKVVVTR